MGNRDDFNPEVVIQLHRPNEVSKPNLSNIALKLRERGYRPNCLNVEDLIVEALIEAINPQLEAWTEEVLDLMQDLEHPEPRTKAEYDERYGLDKE